MKILVPGGHLTPALGFIDFVQQEHPEVDFLFVGRKYSQSKLKQEAIEEKEVSKRAVKFIELDSVRSSGNIFSSLRSILSFFQALKKSVQIINHEKPSVVLSFGGYLAVPLVIAAKLLKVPIVAHEGTSVVGKANRLIFKFADQIAVSYPNLLSDSAISNYSRIKLTGTPLRKKIISKQPLNSPTWFSNQSNLPIILILGGNQGSLAINQLVKSSLNSLVPRWIVVHQCGRPNKLYHYRQELNDFAQEKSIPEDRYYVLEWIDEDDLVWLYQHAFVAVARAGANTIEELIFHQLPAIFIPLPYSNYSEQLKNARYLEKQGAGVILTQEHANTDNLISCLASVNDNHKKIKTNISSIDRPNPLKASQMIFDLIKTVSSKDEKR